MRNYETRLSDLAMNLANLFYGVNKNCIEYRDMRDLLEEIQNGAVIDLIEDLYERAGND